MDLKNMRTLVAEWNNTFPLDYWWRRRYKIAFNSPEHRAANQIDIYFEWLEEKLYEEYYQQAEEDKENAKLYEKGIILKEKKESEEDEEELFNKLDVRAINNNLNIKITD